MRNATIKMYSLAAPLFMLPLMDFGFDQIIPYLKGMEFRAFMAEILTQVASGVADAVIVVGVQSLFGA